MFFDRFDIMSAHYAFYCDFYSGMSDVFYMKLCRIQKTLTVSPMWKGFESLSDNGKWNMLEV
jgi:hypothetical protein